MQTTTLEDLATTQTEAQGEELFPEGKLLKNYLLVPSRKLVVSGFYQVPKSFRLFGRKETPRLAMLGHVLEDFSDWNETDQRGVNQLMWSNPSSLLGSAKETLLPLDVAFWSPLKGLGYQCTYIEYGPTLSVVDGLHIPTYISVNGKVAEFKSYVPEETEDYCLDIGDDRYAAFGLPEGMSLEDWGMLRKRGQTWYPDFLHA